MFHGRGYYRIVYPLRLCNCPIFAVCHCTVPDLCLLPIKQAAKWLGLTVWRLRERIWAGQIPVVQFPGGRKMFIDVKDLEAFIQKNKRIIT